MKILLFLFLFGCIACKSDKVVSEKSLDQGVENKADPLIEDQCNRPIRSGIEGMVTFLEGDAMPGPDGPMAKPHAVQREIWICQPLKRLDVPSQEGVFFQIDQNRVVVSKLSTKEGCYRISLDPGIYSVLIKEGDKGWFANLFDQNDLIQPIIIESGRIAKMDLLINYKAAY